MSRYHSETYKPRAYKTPECPKALSGLCTSSWTMSNAFHVARTPSKGKPCTLPTLTPNAGIVGGDLKRLPAFLRQFAIYSEYISREETKARLVASSMFVWLSLRLRNEREGILAPSFVLFFLGRFLFRSVIVKIGCFLFLLFCGLAGKGQSG